MRLHQRCRRHILPTSAPPNSTAAPVPADPTTNLPPHTTATSFSTPPPAPHQLARRQLPFQMIQQQRQRAVGQEFGAAGAAQRGAAAAGGVSQRIGPRRQQQLGDACGGRGGRAASAVAAQHHLHGAAHKSRGMARWGPEARRKSQRAKRSEATQQRHTESHTSGSSGRLKCGPAGSATVAWACHVVCAPQRAG